MVNAALIAKTALEDILRNSYKETISGVYSRTITDVLQPFHGSLIVTPRKIDDLIQNAGTDNK